MAESGISAPAEGEVWIRDDYLEQNMDNPNVRIDLRNLTPVEAFEERDRRQPPTGPHGNFLPRGVCINYALESGVINENANYARINRCLNNNQPTRTRVRRYACGVTHPERIKFIFPNGTTARGISIQA